MTDVAFFCSRPLHVLVKVGRREVGLLHSLLDPAVAEDRLQPFDPPAVLEIVGGEGVPQIVRPEVLHLGRCYAGGDPRNWPVARAVY